MKRTLTIAALAAALAVPALAQQQPMSGSPSAQPSTSTMPMRNSTSAQQPGFVQRQDANDWRASRLVGTTVYGPDNRSIGEVSDLILSDDGQAKAAVIGVGGFLGVGQKDVAVPFSALTVKRKPDSASIDKIVVSFTKDQLKNAPAFAYYKPSGQAPQTTGSGASSSNPMGAPRPTDTPMSR